MEGCRFCGGLVLEVSPGLFKCIGLCGQYFKEGAEGPLPKIEVATTLDKLRAHEAGVETTTTSLEGGLSADMLIFINRVAERLVPTEGLTHEMTEQVKKVQNQFRRELTEVIQGKQDFNKWFNKTKTNLGLHAYKLTTTLYESLAGLKSPEAQELLMQYGEALQRLGRAYQPPMM